MTETKRWLGKRVRFTPEFLRSVGAYTGPEAPCSYGPFARGEVMMYHEACIGIVWVKWDDGWQSAVNTANLETCR